MGHRSKNGLILEYFFREGSHVGRVAIPPLTGELPDTFCCGVSRQRRETPPTEQVLSFPIELFDTICGILYLFLS